MQIDRRITNGLAWAGVILVVGVPAADFVTGRLAGDGAPTAQVAVIEEEAPVPAPAAQRPAAQVAATPKAVVPVRPVSQTSGAVAGFEQSGRPLPSYINDAPAATPAPVAAVRTPIVTEPVVAEPVAPVRTATTPPVRQQIITPQEQVIDPVQVASIPPKVAPMPRPLSMRPRATIEPQFSAMPQPVVVAPVGQPVYVPPSVQAPVAVTADDLEDWETGPLADFLARRQQPQQANVDRSYDEDGFFLDEGPNGQDFGRDRLVGPAPYFMPFSN